MHLGRRKLTISSITEKSGNISLSFNICDVIRKQNIFENIPALVAKKRYLLLALRMSKHLIKKGFTIDSPLKASIKLAWVLLPPNSLSVLKFLCDLMEALLFRTTLLDLQDPIRGKIGRIMFLVDQETK